MTEENLRIGYGEIGSRQGASPGRGGSIPPAPHPKSLRQMIREYYEIEGNGAGGSLHIVLDDGNIETSNIQYCRAYAEERGDWRGVILADMLLARTRRGRGKLCR